MLKVFIISLLLSSTCYAQTKSPSAHLIYQGQTQSFGKGYITRTPSGKTIITQSFGSGFISRGPGGNSQSVKFGSGFITRSGKR